MIENRVHSALFHIVLATVIVSAIGCSYAQMLFFRSR